MAGNGSKDNHCVYDKSSLNIWKNRITPYLIALRPWSFTVSFTPVTLGCCLAYKTTGVFDFVIFIVVCLSAISVHAAGNLVNTYMDYKHGVDSKKSDDRTLVDEILKPDDVGHLCTYCYLLGSIMFVILAFISPSPVEHLALVYFGGLSGSFMYTGGLGLKYIALGDIVVFLSFGPVTVLYAFLSQGGQLSWEPLMYAMPLSLNACVILHSNNVRDRLSDHRAGIITMAILLGNLGSYLLFTSLLFLPYVIFLFLCVSVHKVFILPVLTIFSALKLERFYRQGLLVDLPRNLALLNLQLGLLYIVSCVFSPPIFLS